ncbi:Sec63 [Rhizophlyctis rosea]|nr:Sec63 [Rhizophlyctis rosea]
MHYIGTQNLEYSELDIMQMLGRAGRPQFDDTGTAVIMTSLDKKAKYEALITGTEIIESSLHDNLIEHLNAEVGLGTIADVPLAIEWLKSSFLYGKSSHKAHLQTNAHCQASTPAKVRIQKNPSHYKLKNCTASEGKLSAERRLESICMKDLELLQQNNLVANNPITHKLEATDFGRAMAKYYIKYQTAVTILQMPDRASLATVLETLCRAEEFAEIRFHQDKQHLNALNKDASIRFPLKKRVAAVADKCALGTVAFTEQRTALSMSQDTSLIMPHASRVSRFMVEVCQIKGDTISLRNAINLSRCLTCKTWENSPLLLKQIETVGPALAKSLATAGINTFQKLKDSDARRIEFAANRNPPFGNKVLDWVNALPQFRLKISQYKDLSRPRDIELYIEVGLVNATTARIYSKNRRQGGVTFLASTSDNVFIDYRHFFMKRVQEGLNFKIRTTMGTPNQKINCSLLAEDFVGIDLHEEVDPHIDAKAFRGARPAKTQQSQPRTGLKPVPSANQSIGSDFEIKAPIHATRPVPELASDHSPSRETDYDGALGNSIDWEDINIEEMLKDVEDPPPLPPPLKFGDGPTQHLATVDVPDRSAPYRTGVSGGGDANGTQHGRPNGMARPPVEKKSSNENKPPAYQSYAFNSDDEGDDIFDLSNSFHRPQPSGVHDRSQFNSSKNDLDEGDDGGLPNGNVPCAHRCEHRCCKEGVPPKVARKRKHLRQMNDMEDEFAAGGSQQFTANVSKRVKVGHASQDRREVSSGKNGLPSDFVDDHEMGEEGAGSSQMQDAQRHDETSWLQSDDEGNEFLDLEAREHNEGEYEEEIDGEFDGWLVSDSEPVFAEAEGDSCESSSYSQYDRSTKRQWTEKEPSVEQSDGDPEHETPLKRRRLVKKRTIVVTSEDEADEPVSQTILGNTPPPRREQNLKHVLGLEVANPFVVKTDLERLQELHERSTSSSIKPWEGKRSTQARSLKPDVRDQSTSSTLTTRLIEAKQTAPATEAKAPTRLQWPELDELKKLHERTSSQARAAESSTKRDDSLPNTDPTTSFLVSPSPTPPPSQKSEAGINISAASNTERQPNNVEILRRTGSETLLARRKDIPEANGEMLEPHFDNDDVQTDQVAPSSQAAAQRELVSPQNMHQTSTTPANDTKSGRQRAGVLDMDVARANMGLFLKTVRVEDICQNGFGSSGVGNVSGKESAMAGGDETNATRSSGDAQG